MRHLLLRLGLISIFLLVCFSGIADEVEFRAEVPSVVARDEVFRIGFSLNATPQDFTPPVFEDFDVLAGPTTSQGQSISIVNGNMTQTVNFTYTYVIQAKKEGIFNIPTAKVTVDGKQYTSQSTKIEVVKEQQSSQASASQGGGASSGSASQQTATLASDDILLRMIVNKRSVYKGEPLRVMIKLYTRVPARIENLKFPVFNGFWSQEIPINQREANRETLNSKVYETQVLQQYLLFPQQSGKLTIDQVDANIVAQVMSNRQQPRSLIDEFFGGGPSIQEIRKVLTAQPIEIQVNELPSGAPSSFSGAVGRFTMNSEISSSDIVANSATAYTLKLTGSGNLPLIQAPKLSLPTSFEQYTMKMTESLNTNTDGVTGYRQYEYPFIARAQGEYVIEPIEFSYFDPKLSEYVTLKTPNIELMVSPDSTDRGISGGAMVSGISKEDLKILGQDIRFIKIGSSGLTKSNTFFLGSLMFYLVLLLIFGLFGFALIFLKKRIKDMQNLVAMRGKKANKVALQRFKAASEFMKQDDKRRFYEEMLRALWGYVGDKLNIPVANLTKDNVIEELLKRGVEASDTDQFIQIISDCECAQYSPATLGKMNEYFDQGVALISKYESIIK